MVSHEDRVAELVLESFVECIKQLGNVKKGILEEAYLFVSTRGHCSTTNTMRHKAVCRFTPLKQAGHKSKKENRTAYACSLL